MQLTDTLNQIGGLKSVAQELGVGEAEAARGADALIPAILGGLKKQMQSRQSDRSDLGGLLGEFGGGGLLDDVLASHPTHIDRGNDILGKLFGSKDVSRAVAQNASAQTQLSPDLLKKMLPMVAMLVTGLMARGEGADTSPSTSLTGRDLGEVLGGMVQGNQPQAKSPGGWSSMLDLDGDGNALDDIMRMAGKFMR